jgi:hypothetical protein
MEYFGCICVAANKLLIALADAQHVMQVTLKEVPLFSLLSLRNGDAGLDMM